MGLNRMFFILTMNEIKELQSKQLAQQISRWESLDKADSYYSKIEGSFTGYKMNLQDLKSAYSTPVVVFKINKLPTN